MEQSTNGTRTLTAMANESSLGQWLQMTPVFQGLSRSQLEPVLQMAQVQSFRKGEMIFRQESEATGFFVIKSGRVKVYKVSPTGKEQILNVFEAGDTFAEVAALDGKPFPAAAATLEATQLIFFPRLAFLELLHHQPDIAVNLLISLAQHLRHLATVIEEMSFKDVPQRLAAYLLRLSEVDGVSAADDSALSPVVTLDLTKSQLAAALGTIPATLSRAFYYLSSEGLIAVKNSQIEVLDRDRLQNLSALTRGQTESPGA
jgi:CRP/FNR family transcriptional regulator, dissimilatory nitrate respiration regulator